MNNCVLYLVVVLGCLLLTSHARPYYSDSDFSPVDPPTELGDLPVTSNNAAIETPPQKRQNALSLNQELRAIAALVFAENQRRKLESVQSRLESLGKRSQNYQATYRKLSASSPYTAQQGALERSGARLVKRRLSISSSLDVLSDMLKAQRNRRLQNSLASSRMKLLAIGKRSTNNSSPSRQLAKSFSLTM